MFTMFSVFGSLNASKKRSKKYSSYKQDMGEKEREQEMKERGKSLFDRKICVIYNIIHGNLTISWRQSTKCWRDRVRACPK